MQIKEATELIFTSAIDKQRPSTWADLGCGSGVFTEALANLLAPKSEILAIDKSNSLALGPEVVKVRIEFQKADFVKEDLNLPLLDGILIANALHYAAEQASLIQKLKRHLKPDGIFLIVEYDTTKSNQWVPYPLSFENLGKLFLANGFRKITKISKRPSVYNTGEMYSSIIHQ